jgi:hypothetical protein
VGREATATEDYAYAAALALAQAIARRAGSDVLQAVWADAAARVGAYQPVAEARGQPETVAGPPDWRGLLDLLEGHDGETYDDLWRLWVVRDLDRPLLNARAAARTRYERLVEAAADWRLPRPIRDALRAWQFEQASALFTRANSILDQRRAIEAAAASAGLVTPPTLQAAFEMSDGFTAAAAEATAELAALARYAAADATRPTEPNPLQVMGMWGATPGIDLDRAADLFAMGDLAGSTDAAEGAGVVWASAEDVGRGRLISIVALTLATLVAVALVAGWLRARRRHRRTYAAHWVGPAPYATLAATLDPPPPVVAADRESGADLS